jgi:hypothetical protein
MAITRSTTKRQVIETIRVNNMGWLEYLLYKFDQSVGAIASLIYSHLSLVYTILISSFVIAYINASSDTFELLAA